MCWVLTCTRLSSSIESSFVCLSKSPVNRTPSRFSSGAPLETDARFQSLPLHTFRVRSKGAQSSHRERFSRALHLSLKESLVNELPSSFPSGTPCGESCPFPEPSFTHLSDSSIKARLLQKSHPSLKVPGKGASLPCSPKWGPSWNRHPRP